jgi:DNA-binding MarR family transcriptional regulator
MDTELENLVNEVRLLFHKCTQLGEQLHSARPVTIAMRGVLELLTREGPASVPAIATQRNVSRQHIQVLVNDLVALGLVRLGDNPSHKRSKLVAITGKGERLFAAMRKREAKVFESAMRRLAVGRLRQATQTLRDVSDALEAAV